MNKSNTLPLLKRLEARARAVDSLLCVGLDPHPELLPEYTAPAAYAFCQRIIDATHDLACAFKPNSAFFEALGGAGFDVLRDVIAYVHAADPTLPVILDAKRGDIASTAEAYARTAFEYLDADGITLNPYMGQDAVAPFLSYPGRGVFVLCRTSNPGAGDFQELMMDVTTHRLRLYEVVAERAAGWNTAENVGLVVGAVDERVVDTLRSIAPDTWFLVPGIGAQGGDLAATVNRARRLDGIGFLINASRSIARADEPREEAQELRDEINAHRRHFAAVDGLYRRPGAKTARLVPSPSTLAWALYSADCIRFGKFTLKSGVESPIYLDLRRLASSPRSLQEVAGMLARYLTAQQIEFDHAAAIPYAALPIATVAALMYPCSLVYPRRETKDYGTGAQVEGAFEPGDVAVLIDDLATTGESKLEAIQKLRAAGLVVRDIVVIIDREQGAREALEAAGFRFHALITLRQLLDELEQIGKLSAEKRQEVDAWLAAQQRP